MSTQLPMQRAIQKAADGLLNSNKKLKAILFNVDMSANMYNSIIQQIQLNTEALVLLGYKVE